MPFTDPATSDAGSNGVMICALLPLLSALVGAYKLSLGLKKAENDLRANAARHEPMEKKCALIISLMMAVCASYGFIGAFVINKNLSESQTSFVPGNAGLATGLVIGLTGSFSAMGLGWYAASAVQSCSLNPRVFVGFILVAIYIEAFALYGLIIGLVCINNGSKSLVDLAPDAAVPFASVSILAMLGGTVGTVLCGMAIMEVGVEQPQIIMKCILPVVFNGVTGIYGLISTVVAMAPWPAAGNDSIAGVFYIVSSMGLAYVGYHGVKDVAKNNRSFLPMIFKLIMCQSIGLVGLVISLLIHGKANDTPRQGRRQLRIVVAFALALFVVALGAYIQGTRRQLLVDYVPLADGDSHE